ncbi:MAG: DUF4145 domain-containing protein [Bdellovibrionota bacterium]|nr:DUF4145 domain-containing protein [Bdellovibrionota bacterium]MEC8625147.1 DUF4145 domain-containing protein [Bdellovibrionota bacterium]
MNWECPYCGSHTVLVHDLTHKYREWIVSLPGKHVLNRNESYEFLAHFVSCPNQNCKEISLKASLSVGSWKGPTGGTYFDRREKVKDWELLPQGTYKNFPSYIPQVILEDYKEACLIKNLSPKASATLARRCLQGMIRDFWKIINGSLNKQINELKNHLETDVYEAIDTIRKMGNIGAHMEKDINTIVEIEEGEVDQLIWLIEFLLNDWYVAKHERDKKLKGLKEMGVKKAPPKS